MIYKNNSGKIEFIMLFFEKFRLLFVLLVIWVIIIPAYSQTSEYRIKAAYLEKFTHFIEWQDTSGMNDVAKPFRISVLGKNPFGRILENIYKNNTIRGKKVQIDYIKNISELKPSQILFLSSSEKNRLRAILKKVQKMDILTISDSPGFGKAGVLINFYIHDSKVLFEINYDSVRKSKVRISYLLMQLARVIGKKNDNLQ